MHYAYGLQRPEEETKTVTFEVEPLMCQKCVNAITETLGKINIQPHQLAFNTTTHQLQVTVPTTVSNEQIIGTLQAAGRKAKQFFPAEKALTNLRKFNF
ncbi:MAG: heavy-metal-associated domain-containing protein [Candidatus Berkiella sp.]